MKNKVNYILIHHSGISNQVNPNQLKAINRYHKSLWNFKSSLGWYIGYHYFINKKGKITQTRADTDVGAHCYDQNMNYNSLGICLQGNFDIEKPEPKQIYALRDLLRKLVRHWSLNKNKIMFHNQYSNTACPGKNMDINFVRSLASKNVIPDIENKKNDKEEILKMLKRLAILLNQVIQKYGKNTN